MISAALLIQILVWAFAAFTEVRYTRMAVAAAQRAPVVVRNNQPAESIAETWSPTTTAEVDNESTALKSARAAEIPPILEPADVSLVFTRADSWLRTMNQIAFVFAIIGILLLALETSLGVVVASAVMAPGVGRVTRAQLWAIFLVALAAPWDRLIPAFPIPQPISNYADMIAITEAYQHQSAAAVSAGVFYGRFLLLPLAVIAAANLTGWVFWQGASTVVMSNAPTAYEQAIENEAHEREAGNVRYGGRAGGALELAVIDNRPLQRTVKTQPETKPAPKPEINIGLMTGTAPLVNQGNTSPEDDFPTAPELAPATLTMIPDAAADSEDDDFRRPI